MSFMVESDTSISDGINKFTRKYLLNTLAEDFYASDFSQKHFDALLNELFSMFGEEKTLARTKTIATCIVNHFKYYAQECKVEITGRMIKVRNTFQEGVSTAEMDRACIGLNVSLQKLVSDKKEYALQEHLLCFSQDILQSLFQKFLDTPLQQDYKNLRNTIRPAVQKSFELSSKDIVLFLRQKLYVRYFVDIRKISQDDNRRFLGMSPELLEGLYKEHFPENFSDVLLDMAPDVIYDALDFGRIDNLMFKAKYIEVFRALVDVAMSEYTGSLDKENVLALNGYVLRLHFDSLLYLCAEILIDMVMKRDRKADEFLRFYNGETVVGSNGKKIKKPFVIDSKQNIWNYSSIFSVMTQCSQFEHFHKQEVSAVKEAEKYLQEAEQALAVSKANEKACSEQFKLLKDELHTCTTQKNRLLNILKPNKEESAELRRKRQEEKALLEKHDKVFSTKGELTLKYENAQITHRNRIKQLEAAKRALESLEKKGEDLYQQQDNIFAALAKALIFR